METKNHNQVQALQKTSCPSTNELVKSESFQLTSPLNDNFLFKKQVMKMKMSDLPQLVLEKKPTSIKKMSMEDEQMTLDVMMLMMLEFQSFFNVKHKMDKSQLLETSYMVLETFRHFSLYDIGMALKNAKAGVYGKFYERIDGSMILEFFLKYDHDRTRLILEKRQEQDKQNAMDCKNLGDRTSSVSLKEFLS